MQKADNMKMTRTSDELFKHAVELFFGMNPIEPWWFLVAFYFAKKRRLSIVENDGFISKSTIAYMDKDYAQITFDKEHFDDWEERDVKSLALLVKDVAKDSIEENIIFSLASWFRIKMHGASMMNNVFKQKQWEPAFLFEVAHCLMEIPDDWYNEHFETKFEMIVERIISNEGRNVGGYIQPKELTQLMVKQLNYKEGSIYNPFTGLASLPIALTGEKCYAQEINPSIGMKAQLRLLAHGCSPDSIHLEDSLVDFKDADYIVCNPPFSLNIRNSQQKDFGFGRSFFRSDAFALYAGALSAKKRFVVALPLGVLFRGGEDFTIRKELIAKGWVEKVIILPQRILQFTSKTLAILVIDKQKPHRDSVQLVDASSCFNEGKRKVNIIDLDAINELIEGESRHSISVSIEQLFSNSCILLPTPYIDSEIISVPGQNIVELKQILTRHRKRTTSDVVGKVLAHSDLPQSKFKVDFNAESMTTREVRVGAIILDEELLVVDTATPIYRSGVFYPQKGVAYSLASSMLVFKYDKTKVLPQYLINELGREYVKEQLVASSYSMFVKITYDEFLSIKINLPSIEKQREIVLNDQRSYINELGLELSALELKQHDDFLKAVGARKHAIGQVMMNVISGMNLISNYVKKHDDIHKQDVVGISSGRTFEDVIASLKSNISRVSKMINVINKDITYGVSEEVIVEDVIGEFVHEDMGDFYSIQTSFNGKHICLMSKDSLLQLLSNIRANAILHGFTDSKKRDAKKIYVIRIETDTIEQNGKPYLQLLIANNGTPLLDGFTQDKVFTWGNSTGNSTGIGAWEVRSIVEHYYGTVTINSYKDDMTTDFCVEYEILLPLSSKEDDDDKQ